MFLISSGPSGGDAQLPMDIENERVHSNNMNEYSMCSRSDMGIISGKLVAGRPAAIAARIAKTEIHLLREEDRGRSLFPGAF